MPCSVSIAWIPGRATSSRTGVATPVPPRQLLARCGYVTESRHTDGLFLAESVARNISAPALGRYASGLFGFLDTRKETEAAVRYIDLLKVATPGPLTLVQGLSGGNQQKVVFAKWLNRDAHILILDEPTRGVDVGAKLEISNLINDLARRGTSVLLITSEAEEMVSLADRVLVLRDGRFVADLAGASINNGTLMEMALGGETVS